MHRPGSVAEFRIEPDKKGWVMPSLIRRTTILVGTFAILTVACSSGSESTASPTIAAQSESNGSGASTSTTATVLDSTGASDPTATASASSSAEPTEGGSVTTVPADSTASTNPIGHATTTTTARVGGPTTTTIRIVTTTSAPRPATTVTPPPTTPAPTAPPTAPPTTPAPTSPPRTIGSCQQLSLDTVNNWRSTLGRPALSSSGSLYSGACSWATHLAENNSVGHAPGVSGEVIAMGSGSCSSALAIWQGSSGHYAVLTSALASSGGIACVKDSDGTFWAVGRVA